jgi:hypothetical protein
LPQLVPTRRLFVNFAYRLRRQEAPDVVVCDNSAHGLRGRAVIELEHAALLKRPFPLAPSTLLATDDIATNVAPHSTRRSHSSMYELYSDEQR